MVAVTAWSEYRHEKKDDEVAAVYPDGIHTTITEGPREAGYDVQTATLDDSEHGLTGSVPDDTDMPVRRGHEAHDEMEDAIVDCVVDRAHGGIGLLVLHSGHYSKPFKRLMGTTYSLRWRESDEREHIWVIKLGHLIADGLPEPFEVLRVEVYGKRFDIPAPDELVFTS